MTSALGGGTPKADESTDKLLEFDNDNHKGRGRGSKHLKRLADVICTCPLSQLEDQERGTYSAYVKMDSVLPASKTAQEKCRVQEF